MKKIFKRMQERQARLQEIGDTVQRENRNFTPEETAEVEEIQRQLALDRIELQRESIPAQTPAIDADKMLRENLFAGKKVTIRPQRDLLATPAVTDTGLIPVDEQEMIKPLRAGLIWDKVGMKVLTGLPMGQLRWPKHTKATAYFANEGEKAPDSKVDFSALSCKPERLVCAIPVTKELLESTNGVVQTVINEEMPAAVIDLVNEATFATDATGRKIYGPLVEAAKTPAEFAADVPTRKELLKMKAKVASSGIKVDPSTCCWVMTENMKSELEDVKVDTGSGRFLCEDDKILGFPVFTTDAIADGVIAFGDWSYQGAGFFGPMDTVVDPYTLARQNSVDFVLNTHFGTATLAKEAFVVGAKKNFVFTKPVKQEGDE